MTRRIFLVAALLGASALSLGDLRVNNLTGFGAAHFTVTPPGEAEVWLAAISGNGGTVTGSTESIGRAFLTQLQGKSYNAHVVYLLPMLGNNIAAAVVPIRDSLHVGKATNHSFVDADFSESVGLQGNGSTKYLDCLVKPSQVGTGTNGGMGYWELNFAGGANSELAGNNTTAGNRFVLDIRTSRHFFSWGNAGNAANQSTSSTSGHYYGNRSSSSSRKLYLDGTLLDTNSAGDSPGDAAERNLLVVGCDEGGAIFPANSLCGVFYLTDGGLSDADAADLHTLISTYLITASGK